MKQEMMVYEAPQVEVIEVEVEKGFAASPDYTTPGMDGYGNGGNY